MSNKKDTHKHCTVCGELKEKTRNYYKSSLIFFPDERIPVCKACVYTSFEEVGFKAFQAVMKLIDKPIYEDQFTGDYKRYITTSNSLGHFESTFYEDSTLFESSKANVNVKKKLTKLTKEELDEAMITWGDQYQENDYIFLIEKYNQYAFEYGLEEDITLRSVVQQICLSELDIRLARANKAPVDKLLKTYSDLLATASLKPSQQNAASGKDQESHGVWIKKIESERPIPRPVAPFNDVDYIAKQVRVHFFGNMMKSFNRPNIFQKEYDEEYAKYTITPEGLHYNSDDEDFDVFSVKDGFNIDNLDTEEIDRLDNTTPDENSTDEEVDKDGKL